MSTEESETEMIRQPAMGQPIKAPRPPLDWGDEEPDPVWEELYRSGQVSTPYQGHRHGRTIAQIVRSWKPIGQELTDSYLMCALGRCDCCQ